MCVFFHGFSIVEQENWGNALYDLARYYFAMGARTFAWTVFCPDCLLPELSLPRIAVLIAIMADGAIAGYRLASIFSLMRVLTGCRGGWWCLCQLGDQLGHQ